MSSLPSVDDAKLQALSSPSTKTAVSGGGLFGLGFCTKKCFASVLVLTMIVVLSIGAAVTHNSGAFSTSRSAPAPESGGSLDHPEGSRLPPTADGDGTTTLDRSDLPVITLTSPAFDDGRPIPVKYTTDGDDLSPRLEWTDVPPSTKSLVIFMHDPDAGKVSFTHWVLFNIPPSVSSVPEGIEHNTTDVDGFIQQGVNSKFQLGYAGPRPQRGSGEHRYLFEIFAANGVTKNLKPEDATRRNVLDEYTREGYDIVGRGELMGTYRRD